MISGPAGFDVKAEFTELNYLSAKARKYAVGQNFFRENSFAVLLYCFPGLFSLPGTASFFSSS
jgi:hypothetical protein